VTVDEDSTANGRQIGSRHTALTFNIAWGYDVGDEYSHVTSNVSPAVKGSAVRRGVALVARTSARQPLRLLRTRRGHNK